MKKKLLSLILVLALALTLLPTAAFATDDIGEDLPPNGQDEQLDDIQEGSSDPHTHAVKDTVAAKSATCTEAGNTAYYSCDCGKYFSDQALTTEIALAATVINATGHDWSNKDGVCKTCSAKCDHSNQTSTACSVCGAAITTSSGGETPGGHAHALTKAEAKAATCSAAGNKEYYTCSTCGKYFSDANGAYEITLAQTVIAALPHTRPAAAADYERTSDSQHSYTCSACNQKFAESHTFVRSVCTVCGFERTTAPAPSRYVDITSAYVNRYSIDVTWRSDAADGAYFDIYVDGSLRARDVRPSKSSSGYFTYTVNFSHYLEDSYYNVAVYLAGDHSVYDSARVRNRDYDYDYNPTVTPGTNSSGIPYASQVTGRYSASEAIRILRNKNSSTLMNDLMNSSSALSSFDDLERAVKRANNVSFSVDIDRDDVPSAFRSSSDFKVVGAAFNASRTNSTVRLVVDAPSRTRYTGHGYQFSMTLTGVDSAGSLDVPVVVTLPLPSDISSSYVRVLHYHGSGSPTVIVPKVSGRTITFPLTGFSDFVVTDDGGYYASPVYVTGGYVSDGYGYVWVPGGVPASPRRNLVDEHLRIVLPILASMPPSGYVYDDVSGSHWAAAAIAWAKDGGLMSGYFDGTFRPNAGTTRQELWMVLARLAGANPADMGAARLWAINAGISDGSNPFSPLSCQQMISMLYRYAQYRGLSTPAPSNLGFYRDGSAVSPYARTAMSWAINESIVVGDGDGCLNPENIATRADFAVYLYRFLN